jgi:galactose-1-phosphate uridylyltransferase
MEILEKMVQEKITTAFVSDRFRGLKQCFRLFYENERTPQYKSLKIDKTHSFYWFLGFYTEGSYKFHILRFRQFIAYRF